MTIKKFYYVKEIASGYVVETITLTESITLAKFLENPPIVIDPNRLKEIKEDADALAAELNSPSE